MKYFLITSLFDAICSNWIDHMISPDVNSFIIQNLKLEIREYKKTKKLLNDIQ